MPKDSTSYTCRAPCSKDTRAHYATPQPQPRPVQPDAGAGTDARTHARWRNDAALCDLTLGRNEIRDERDLKALTELPQQIVMAQRMGLCWTPQTAHLFTAQFNGCVFAVVASYARARARAQGTELPVTAVVQQRCRAQDVPPLLPAFPEEMWLLVFSHGKWPGVIP